MLDCTVKSKLEGRQTNAAYNKNTTVMLLELRDYVQLSMQCGMKDFRNFTVRALSAWKGLTFVFELWQYSCHSFEIPLEFCIILLVVPSLVSCVGAYTIPGSGCGCPCLHYSTPIVAAHPTTTGRLCSSSYSLHV